MWNRRTFMKVASAITCSAPPLSEARISIHVFSLRGLDAKVDWSDINEMASHPSAHFIGFVTLIFPEQKGSKAKSRSFRCSGLS